jgi:hypothetical protein
MTRLKSLSYLTGVLVSIFACTWLAVDAQTVEPVKIKVGDAMVAGSVIKPYKNVWRLTYEKPGSEPIDAATWTDEVEAVTIGGRSLLKRTQIATYKRREITVTTINVFDPQTMAAVSRDFKTSNGTFNHIEFNANSIKYRRVETPGGQVKEGDEHLDAPVFDFYGGLYGLLLTAFPLKTGFSASLPSLDENSDAVRWAIFRVVREEMVEAGPNRRVKAWVVETDDHGPMTFWLTKETPYIIKLVYIMPSGIKATYTMI